MNIINFYKDEPRGDGNHWLLPDPIRAILVGPSACGKSNLLLNLLLQPDWLNWDKAHLICTTSDQPIYDVLHECNEKSKSDEPPVTFIPDVEETPDTEDLDSSIKNIVIFDDVMLENQKNAAKLFSKGRHKGADVIYLTQKYTQIPKVIRDNANFLILFNGIDRHGLRTIFQTWCGDININEFFDFFRKAAEDPYSFAVIDLTSATKNGRYRKQFDEFYVPKQ